MKQLFLLLTVALIPKFVNAQIIENPNFGSKTHPTIHVLTIDKQANATTIYLKAVNKSTNEDWLCIDKNTYIISGNKRIKLLQTEGIANCPDNFKFTYKGQELNFSLKFPSLNSDVLYVDLVEDCTNFCFKFSGLIVNSEINDKLNIAYTQFRENKLAESAQSFETALKLLGNYPYAIFTYNLIEIYAKLQNKEKLAEWKMKFHNSAFTDKQLYKQLVDNIQ